MSKAEAVRALLEMWSKELGEDAAQALVFGLLLARADPTLAQVLERGLEEMLDGDRHVALANQGARERWCAGVREWLREQGVAA